MGSDEFVDSMIHRMGEVKAGAARGRKSAGTRDLKGLIEAV